MQPAQGSRRTAPQKLIAAISPLFFARILTLSVFCRLFDHDVRFERVISYISYAR